MRAAEPLTVIQRAELLRVLRGFGDRIEQVDLYGSRARGTHRPGSDVDLILRGRLDDRDMLRIAVALEESDLSLFVDLRREGDTMDAMLEAELARDRRTLFSADDLKA